MMRALALAAALVCGAANAQTLTGPSSPGAVSFTPVVTCTNAHAPTTVTASGSYFKSGSLVTYAITVTMTNAGTCVSGDLLYLGSLPFTATAASAGFMQSPTTGKTGFFAMPAAANYGNVAYYDSTWSGATSTVMYISGSVVATVP